MNKMTKLAASISIMIVSTSGVSAADWNVTQDANITVAAPTMNQGATTNVVSSNQAINGIALDTTNDDLATGSQTADLASSTGVVLNQGEFVDGANQAINYIAADNVGSVSVITQTVNQTATSNTAITQEASSLS